MVVRSSRVSGIPSSVYTVAKTPGHYIGLVLKLHGIENPIFVFPEKEFCGLSPNFYIHESVSDLYIPTSVHMYIPAAE
jgi:hypothetical protein